MSDRELRKSTRDASERLKQRQEAKQLLKEINIRRTAYSEAITEAENQISELQEAADTSLNKTLDWDFENSDFEDDEEIEPLQAAKSPENSVISQRDTHVRHSPSPRLIIQEATRSPLYSKLPSSNSLKSTRFTSS